MEFKPNESEWRFFYIPCISTCLISEWTLTGPRNVTFLSNDPSRHLPPCPRGGGGGCPRGKCPSGEMYPDTVILTENDLLRSKIDFWRAKCLRYCLRCIKSFIKIQKHLFFQVFRYLCGIITEKY